MTSRGSPSFTDVSHAAQTCSGHRERLAPGKGLCRDTLVSPCLRGSKMEATVLGVPMWTAKPRALQTHSSGRIPRCPTTHSGRVTAQSTWPKQRPHRAPSAGTLPQKVWRESLICPWAVGATDPCPWFSPCHPAISLSPATQQALPWPSAHPASPITPQLIAAHLGRHQPALQRQRCTKATWECPLGGQGQRESHL